MMASPWNANSSTNVRSSAAIENGPIRSSAASNAIWPRRSSARRQSWARMTGITMYSPTDTNSVSHGTVMADRPSNSPTTGAKANTMIVSLSATWDSVKAGSPPVNRLQTKTMAVHGAAARRMRPAM
ncbi:hypothetical protein D3C71_1826800 [compost metagenome]